MSTQTLTLYAVRNEQGQWLRAKGFGGYGDTWTTWITTFLTKTDLDVRYDHAFMRRLGDVGGVVIELEAAR